MNPLLIPELRELVHEKDTAGMADFIGRLHPAQAADLVEGLECDELTWILGVLPVAPAALLFEYLPQPRQLELAIGTGRKQLATLVSELSPDDRAELVRRLPEPIVDEMLPLMAQAEREDVKRLLSFPSEVIGARMTTEYAAIGVDLNCGDALAKVRREAPDKETIYTIYVVDGDRHLKGVMGLKELLLARPDAPVRSVMKTEVASARADEPPSRALELLQKLDVLAIPVVDDASRLLGIVTVDDLMDVARREATEDILSLGGVQPGALDRPYFENAIGLVVRKRVGWLLLLFIAEMFTGTVLRHYDETLAKVVSLAFFIPLLLSAGGNAGSQTVSTIIRSLALGEIVPRQWLRVLAREGLTGLLLGMLLGVVGFTRALIWNPHDVALALTVGTTLLVICAWANGVAAIVPLFAQRAGVDPTVLSAPLIATLVDATGLLIYFNVAFFVLPQLHTPEAAIPQAIVDGAKALAAQAPPDLANQILQVVGARHAEAPHPHEWLLPAVALVILGGVLLAISRRKKGV